MFTVLLPPGDNPIAVKYIISYRSKKYPITGLDRPWGFLEFEAPRFQDNRHM